MGRRILLYSPDVIGHPRVYCRVIVDALEPEQCEVVVAMGFTDEVGLAQSPDLQPLSGRSRVELVSTREHSVSGSPHLRAEEIVNLQRRYAIDTTLFIEADKSKAEIERIASGNAGRLIGRNLGIFANTAEWYPGEDSFTGEPRRLLGPTVRTTLGNVKRAVFDRRKSARHFFENTVIRERVLDEILVKDERLADWRGGPVYWMPEISRPVAAPESSEDAVEYDERRVELETFLAANLGRERVLYFGDAAYYKGYDLFLEFVAANPDICGVHAGRTYDAQQRSYFRCDVEGIQASLRSQGRLLETGRYVHTKRLKEMYFGCVRVYLTTHRLALSSSTMIQALELGKPVLVPDRGLIGHRVQANNLGLVYRYEDLDDLGRKARKLWSSDLPRFREPARKFWSLFSDEAIRAFFVGRLVHAA